MKHSFVNRDGKKFTIIANSKDTNNSKLNDTDYCIYCNLKGEKVIMHRYVFDNIYEHIDFLDTIFPCISNNEYTIKQLLE